MEIVFQDLEKIVNSPCGDGSFKIEVEGENVTKVGEFDFIGCYVLTDMMDLAKALVKLKQGEDEITVKLNGSIFSIDLERANDQEVGVTTRVVVDSDGFSEKNSGDYLVEINDFCREMIRVIDRMEETRKREQDDYPARWKGLGETLKELRKELKALLAS